MLAAPDDSRDLRPLLWAGALGALAYLALWWGYRAGFRPELDADDAVLRRLAPHAVPDSAWTHTFEAISLVLGPTMWRVVAVGVLLLALRRRQFPPPAQFAVLGVLLGGFVAQGAKLLADRSRPGPAAVSAFSSSYPSAHAFGVTVAAVGSLFWLWPRLSRRGRWAAGAAAALVVGLVCFARLALAVHHLSDVLAGVGLGLAWTALSVLIIRRAGRVGRHTPSQSANPGGR
ncbi:phosphatase PAP2 family protein [Skermania piniformis]|uniref:Phosphatase PAP2 family protein n=1 Tax=Skermania pinensis TaxID=39122 RepID=A0ABX8S7J6_9ACTN|nr:phosphatase PAP2 family protein [Skermania piniformis]QXQ13818.1 phosphatase PAP2 family protein [Skermania piniformis]